MKFTLQLVLAAAAIAAPTLKESQGQKLRRQMNDGGITDVDILNFALTLEHLENTFYQEGLAQFSQEDFDSFGSVTRLRENIGQISRDETTHVTFLTTALEAAGATATGPGTYNFGITDVASFLRTANILEGVGIAAYLGAAAAIAEPAYLTAAGSILTVESRHSAYLRDNQSPPMSPFPAAFDIPLDPNAVLTLASLFITSLPSDVTLPFTANPSLTKVDDGLFPSNPGTTISLTTADDTPVTGLDLWCAYPFVAGPVFTKAEVTGDNTVSCAVPATDSGVSGQTFALLTNSGTELSAATTVAGPAVVFVTAPYLVGGFGNEDN